MCDYTAISYNFKVKKDAPENVLEMFKRISSVEFFDGDPTKPHILLSKGSIGFVGVGTYDTLADCGRAIEMVKTTVEFILNLTCTPTATKQDHK